MAGRVDHVEEEPAAGVGRGRVAVQEGGGRGLDRDPPLPLHGEGVEEGDLLLGVVGVGGGRRVCCVAASGVVGVGVGVAPLAAQPLGRGLPFVSKISRVFEDPRREARLSVVLRMSRRLLRTSTYSSGARRRT